MAFFTFGVLLLHAVLFSGHFGRALLCVATCFLVSRHIIFSLRWFHDHVTHPCGFHFFGMALAAFSQRRPRSNGRSQLTFFPRQFQGSSESFYLIFAYPLHKHLVVHIILVLADEDADFTCDIGRICCTSSFMWKQCMTFSLCGYSFSGFFG